MTCAQSLKKIFFNKKTTKLIAFKSSIISECKQRFCTLSLSLQLPLLALPLMTQERRLVIRRCIPAHISFEQINYNHKADINLLFNFSSHSLTTTPSPSLLSIGKKLCVTAIHTSSHDLFFLCFSHLRFSISF